MNPSDEEDLLDLDFIDLDPPAFDDFDMAEVVGDRLAEGEELGDVLMDGDDVGQDGPNTGSLGTLSQIDSKIHS